MILESWSIALITCSVVTFIFGVVGAVTALQVLRYWDIGSDSEQQIRLEEQIWLAATLVEFGLVVQIISAIIFIYAADYFATVLTGAMCAAGSLSANYYGLPALGFKLATIFLGTLWIILHRLDIGSEDFLFTGIKSYWLLALLPLLIVDGVLVILYLVNLEPEIITSCCGIIFGGDAAGGYSLFDYSSSATILSLLAITTVLLLAGSVFQLRAKGVSRATFLIVGWLLVFGWVGFYLLALVVITVLVSPYVYAMPHHRCPFDLLQYPYVVIGFPLYLFLHGAVLSGLSAAMASIAGCLEGAGELVDRFIRRAALLNISLTLLFIMVAGWQPFVYIVLGGQ
ncbi:MAG: hypothetical protein ACR2PB_03700 [Desulfocapsaceae bacterium]